MKRFFLLSEILLCLSFLVQAQTPPEGSPVARWGSLHVQGTQLTAENGEPVTLRGMSLFDTTSYGEYANPEVLAWLRDDWKATVFRAAMYTNYNGRFVGEAAYGPLVKAVQAALDTGMYVIIDWHILTDGNPLVYLPQAKAFFTQMASRFGSNPNVLYEICNEPNGKGVTWADAVKPYALEVIAAIRAVDPDNVIVVGTPEWSSQPQIAAADPLPFDNLMYTLHFYAGSHNQTYLDRLDSARALGAAVFITEWGASNAQVTGSLYVPQTYGWIAELEHRQISWANWSLGTKLEPASALKPFANLGGGWSAGELTESGLLLRRLLRQEASGVQFADNFESGNFKAGGWVREGAALDKNLAVGTASVRFEGKAALRKTLLSETVSSWTWSFLARGEGWKAGDRILLEWSTDGVSWSPVKETFRPEAEWTLVTGTLPVEIERKSGVQIRLRSDFASASARYWVDEFALAGTNR